MKNGPAEKLPAPTSDLQLEAAGAPLTIASQKTADMPAKLQQKWNTKNLGLRLGADATSAASAAALVAPIISIIDR